VSGAAPAIVAVRAVGVSKRYGEHRALAKVDLELRAGTMTAIVGHNGAGKSTLLGILSTLVRASTGTVAYQQAAGELTEPRALRAQIGLLSHASLCYPELSAEENLVFFAGLYGVADGPARARQLLDEVGLDAAARQRPARTYSRGMVQRLSLARALIGQPSLLLLDEPFTGLDRGAALALGARLAALKAAGTIVAVITHDLEAIAGIADELVVLRGGKIVHRADVAQQDYAALRAVYGEHAA
jgi:heme exporter protein A